MITEDYCNNENCQLLQSLKFDGVYDHEWHSIGLVHKDDARMLSDIGIPAPTVNVVIKWLRVVHNIQIYTFQSAVDMKFLSTIYLNKDKYKHDAQFKFCRQVRNETFEGAENDAIYECLTRYLSNESKESNKESN